MALQANFQGRAKGRKHSEICWLSKRMDKVRIFRHEMTEWSLNIVAYRSDPKKIE